MFRVFARLLAILLWTVSAMPVQAVLLALPGRGKERFARTYWRGVARILGLRVSVRGTLAAARPVLYVANHCSWLDIVALGSVLPACFVAKGDVAKWPVINWVARLGRTVFVSRNKASVGREQNALSARLAAGDNIILFPEGTTSDGSRILPFASSFLALAEAPARPHVQPVTLVYDGLDGLPVRRRDRPGIAWYGDMTLAPHFLAVARRRDIHATMILDAPIEPGNYPNRKVLAAALEGLLAANAARLRQGRK
jgi:1-acyl-sn-glycerol-3-phosphate acyltransferase